MPAGNYFVGVGQSVYQIRSTESRLGPFGLCITNGAAPGKAKSRLLFNRYGDQCNLAEISTIEGGTSTIPKSKKEREVAVGKSDSLVKNRLKSEPVYIATQSTPGSGW